MQMSSRRVYGLSASTTSTVFSGSIKSVLGSVTNSITTKSSSTPLSLLLPSPQSKNSNVYPFCSRFIVPNFGHFFYASYVSNSTATTVHRTQHIISGNQSNYGLTRRSFVSQSIPVWDNKPKKPKKKGKGKKGKKEEVKVVTTEADEITEPLELPVDQTEPLPPRDPNVLYDSDFTWQKRKTRIVKLEPEKYISRIELHNLIQGSTNPSPDSNTNSNSASNPTPTNYRIIDLREPVECKYEPSIPQAVHIPAEDIGRAFSMTVGSWPSKYSFPRPMPEDSIIVYATPETEKKALKVYYQMTKFGFPNVRIFIGGAREWNKYYNPNFHQKK